MSTDDKTEDFAAMLAEFEQESPDRQRLRNPKVGESVKGRILSIGQDAVFIDLGAKSEGMIDLAEVRDDEGRLTVAVGEEIEARVVEQAGKSGCIVLRRSLGRGPEAKAELQQAHAHGIPVEGLVTGVNKGGVEVQVAGVRAFCPISQLDARHVEDATPYIGQKLLFLITRYEPGRGREMNLVLSRRTLLERESKARAVDTRAKLAVGAVLRGTVTTLKDYGAFVDLGGIEGMLHVSEIGHARVNRPQDVLSVGQSIEVQVLKMEKSEDPKRPEKISLSLKSLERDPWQDARERFSDGARISGTVARVEPFGAFVVLLPGIEGLLHISELGAGRKINHAREILKPGQTVEVTVLAMDPEKHRISLSLAAAPDPDDLEAPSPSSSADASAGEKPRFGTFADLLKGTKKK